MPNIVRVTSPQPWRLVVAFDGTPSTTAGNYSLARTDGLTSSIVITFAFLTGSNAVTLALSSPLLEGIPYTVSASGSGTTGAVGGPVTPTQAMSAVERRQSERRWGVDLAWCSSGGLDARRQVPRRAGRECVRHDLAALCLLVPGEVFHRPRAGANLTRFTNASSTLQTAVAGAIRTAWTRDPRVRTGTVTLDVSTDGPTGETEITGEVTLDASGEVLALDSTDVR